MVEKSQGALGTTQFLVSNIPALVSSLTFEQKGLLNNAWNHFIATGKPYPRRSLPNVIGKQSPEKVFGGLNGSLIYEVWEQGGRAYKLTVHGALLTDNGIEFAVLLGRLLENIRTLYEQDTYIGQLSSDQLRALGFSDHDTQLLCKLLYLQMLPGLAVQIGGLSGDGKSWTLAIGEEVLELYRAEDGLRHLDACLSAGYKPSKPVHETLSIGNNTNTTWLEVPATDDALAPSTQQYVSTERIAELKTIENDKADCTRLICMCEELNDCASRGNAHASIMLLRAVLDHVPPVFGHESFVQVASNYVGGGKSFKKSAERLEKHSRAVADRLLHTKIRSKEVAPRMHEVSFPQELETVLSEFCRLLKRPA